MKKIYFFLFAALLVSCQKAEDKTTDYALFSGKIAGTQESKLILRNFENNSIKEIPIDGQGVFSDTLKGILPGYYSISVGDNRATVYLEPGYSLSLQSTAGEFDETLIYSGMGNAENNYLAQKMLLQRSLAPVLHYKNLGSLDEKVFLSTSRFCLYPSKGSAQQSKRPGHAICRIGKWKHPIWPGQFDV